MPVPPTVRVGNSCDRVILYLGLLLKDALCCDAHIVVVGERFANKLLQLRLAENRRPLLIAERALGRR